jgi:hypothetical protein
MRLIPVVLAVSLFTAPTIVAGQEADASDQEKEAKPKWSLRDDLLTGTAGRLARALSIKVSAAEQADEVLVGATDGDSPEPIFQTNPMEHLYKVEMTLNPGRLAWGVADFKSAYALATPGKNESAYVDAAEINDPLFGIPPDRKLEYLVGLEGGGLFKRYANALSLTIGRSERPRFIGSTLIPIERSKDDKTEVTFKISYDAPAVFISPEEIADALEVLESHAKLHPNVRTGAWLEPPACEYRPVKCLRLITNLPIRTSFLRAVLPTIEFQTVDQFDFVTAGGNFFPATNDTLRTLTAVWDLKALDTAKNRRDAIKAYAAVQRLAAREARLNHPLKLTNPAETFRNLRSSTLLRIELKADFITEGLGVEPTGVKWKLTDSDPGISLTEEGILSIVVPAGSYGATVEAVDDVRNSLKPIKLIIETK